MVDILTCGWSALQTLRNRDLNLVIHAHRAGHAAFTRNPKHGISMNVIAKIVRIIGLDQLHVGAAFGKMSEGEGEVKRNCEVLRGDLYGLKEVMPVASGGLHPRTVPPLIENFGLDIVIQAGGGIHGHPGGTISGAKAMRQAIEASVKGVSLDDYAGSHPELDQALKLWL